MKSSPRGDVVLAVSLTVSALFHLSMVSVFRIVVYFPRHDIEYFDVSIIEAPPPVQSFMGALDAGEGPGLGRQFERLDLAEDPLASRTLWSDLPAIQFPTLRFDELSLLRSRRKVLETRSRYNEVFEDEPGDAWALLGRKLTSVGATLTRFAHGSARAQEAAPRPVSRPAPGFEAYLEWLSEPRDRQPLSVHPINALWGLDPAEFGEPIVLIFRVDRDGVVVDVLDPVREAGGILEGSAEALMLYRFEPLVGDGPPTQLGTLIIRAGGNRE